MPAYLVGTIRIRNAQAWQRYVEQVGATFPPFGGRVLFRGLQAMALSGPAAPGQRVVAVEFPDLDALRRWHDSPAYQALIAQRDAGARVELAAYES